MHAQRAVTRWAKDLEIGGVLWAPRSVRKAAPGRSPGRPGGTIEDAPCETPEAPQIVLIPRVVRVNFPEHERIARHSLVGLPEIAFGF